MCEPNQILSDILADENEGDENERIAVIGQRCREAGHTEEVMILGKPKGGKPEDHRKHKQQKEYDEHEVGGRAAKGLASENVRPWGMSDADGAIARRAGKGI